MAGRYAQSRPAAAPARVAPLQVKGRFLTALVLRADAGGEFLTQLDEQLHKTPQFFFGAPMVLDLGAAPELHDIARLRTLLDQLRRRDLRVFGVQNADEMPAAALQEIGIIHVTTGRDAPVPRQQDPARPADARPPVQNKVVQGQVRSGQTVVAEHGDLTVIGSVASGAELMAAGSIHVYGTLRGRALAGCHGDESAHVFCQNLNAELVAIAGLYQTSETLDEAGLQRCTHFYLKDERLCMEVIA